MEEQTGFNIRNHNWTNEDLEVVYTPDSSIVQYEYEILKDGESFNKELIENNEPTSFLLTETGVYQIRIITTDTTNHQRSAVSGLYKIDKEVPVIHVKSRHETLKEGASYSPMIGVTATDKQDGNITNKITNNYNESYQKAGVHTITYKVTDQAGNEAKTTVTLQVVAPKTNELLFFQTGLLITVLIGILILLRHLKTVRLEKRIGKYGISYQGEQSPSLMDEIYGIYKKCIQTIKKMIKKSVFLSNYSKKYDKYIGVLEDGFQTGMDIVSMKFFFSILVLLLAIVSKTIQSQVLQVYEIVIPILVGFYLPDMFYQYSYRKYRSSLENDLLQGIIIMNNAFKSGRSIVQAIDLVAKELKGPIGKEFQKMSMELSFGLSIEEVFKRFNERIKLEEVAYLTASLSILNKTGGNIINVFSSIETSLFSKKKLKFELESLTGSSKILMYVLFCVPILFILLISLLNPTYFAPFFASPLGLLIAFIILIMYIIYIIIVRKIMKVRM